MNRFVFALSFLLAFSFGVFAQQPSPPQTQEISESDGVPVIVKHLPEWENVQSRAALIKNADDLRDALGERPVFDLIDFEGGTEAVTAPYDGTGKLLIVEYNTPQGSIETDEKVRQRLAENPPNPPIYYRRVGNYNVFVFDAPDETVANTLIDQIKYEKIVQWLGEDPFLYERQQRSYAITLAEVFFSTVLAIVSGIGLSVLTGIGVGVLFFYVRKKQRDQMESFSDAGGMLRLNLDELTPDVPLEEK
ncbi:MAG TPA: hypothetical protein VK400_13195 [Pyrinomonadaceae bacterium]|nr:hypothetical protein [Pyrinomonadaceae bacterium]